MTKVAEKPAQAAQAGGQGRPPASPRRTCGAKNRRGVPCEQAAGYGTDHLGFGNCKFHFGSVRNGRRHARKEAAALALEMLGIAVPIDPITGLRTAIWEAWGNVTFLRHQCQKLGVELVGDVMAATRDGDLYATSEEARAMVRLYGEWHDRFTKACVAAAKIGLAEAEIQLARQHAALVAEIVFGVIDGLKLPPSKADEARALFGREFRRVAPSLGTVEMS